MRFSATDVAPATIVDLEPFTDERGYFARAFCAEEFAAAGLTLPTAQTNLSHNVVAGTLRGLHMQLEPAAEAKFVRAVRGAVFDVAVDMRPDSPTHLQWVAAELTADNQRAMFVPEGFAHGLQSLEDDTLVIYQVSEFYTPSTERGFRYDDPAIGIDWPLEVAAISDKDASWPLLDERADAEAGQ